MKKGLKKIIAVITAAAMINILFAGMRTEPVNAAIGNVLSGVEWTHFTDSWEENDAAILDTKWTDTVTGFDADISITGWQQFWCIDFDGNGNLIPVPEDAYICNDSSWGDKPYQLSSTVTADVVAGGNYTLKITVDNKMVTQSGTASTKSFTVKVWSGIEGEESVMLFKTYTVAANSAETITETIRTDSDYRLDQVNIQIFYGSYGYSREVTKDLVDGKITQEKYDALVEAGYILAPYTNQEDNLKGRLSFAVELNGEIAENTAYIPITDAGTTNGLYTTSTNSILGYNSYSSLLSSLNSLSTADFTNFKKTLATKNGGTVDGIIIPGLAQTNQGNNTACNTMVPQGVCAAGDYLLISAYAYSGKQNNSVIYVMNKNTKKYVTTIILKDNKSHVGALAWNGKKGSNGIIYIADSTSGAYKIWKMPYSVVVNSVSMGKDAVYATLTESVSVRLKPGFLTYYGGYVYVGEFVENNNAKMVTYNETLLSEFNPTAIELPVNTQGISFAQGKDGNTYMFASTSYGRKNKSTVYVCKAKMNGKRVTSLENNKKSISFPNMSEDICVDSSGFLYTVFESAANPYRLNLDNSASGTSQNQVDRVTISSVSNALKIAGIFTDFSTVLKSGPAISAYTKSVDENEGAYEEDVMITGECGENLEFVLYNDGVLCITGYGAMNDYTSGETPWSDYAERITSLCIGADVTSIGNYAFYDLENLLSVTFSEFLYDGVFSIGEYAFGNCYNLLEVRMPDIAFVIDDTAFPSVSDNLQICSDSESVSEYCFVNSISIHTHTYVYKEKVSATCGSYGYDVYECECGEEMHDNFTEPTYNHNFALISSTESTCDHYGIEEYQCSECGAYYEEELELTDHTWDSGVVTREPAADATGIKTYTCSVCGETKEEIIQKLSVESTANGSVTTSGDTEEITTRSSVEITTGDVTTKPDVISKILNIKKTSIKKLKAKKKTLIILWNKKRGINGYQIQYSTTKKFKKSKKVTIKKAAKSSRTIKKLKAKKKYYVRIRTYVKVNGVKYYSVWSKVKSKKTK